MRGISELSKSLSRASSVNAAPRPTILTEKNGDDANPTTESQQQTPKAEKVPTPSRSADNLFAMVDALARAPSQDISRPFDSIPPPRASESKSWSKGTKKRRSVVSTLPPTVDTLGESLTPFSDGFKLFVQEPVPKRPGSPSTSVIPSLVSNTTLDDPEVPSNMLASLSVSEPAVPSATITPKKTEEPTATPQSPPPTKDGFFKGLLRAVQIKKRVTSYWQPNQTVKSQESFQEKPSTANPPVAGTSPKPSADVANGVSSSMKGYEEKNSSNSSLGRGFGSFRRLGRRSRDLKEPSTSLASPLSAKFPNMDKETNAANATSTPAAPIAERKSAEGDSEAPLQPPPTIVKTSEDGRSSPRYSHGVLLHPIKEDERTEEAK
ncbi:SubName: Full=Uncharacterized protein {ECO:0000313/EMBL:CCA70119.1} [Serendipita indica DSM 11827]|uniref:Uncharacterized protein n=1 Tax=Serendipita indica (strain DSM 11827) TaxID=1109443 RepID=G4TFM6_SERID|nr:SubName: Full=Uncharacterized protein {ECO:0000313/EMBL:CCA70119.1} [Serendipita indica DSM 11827]CCA70119.1 hypothetical protein PIIN_04058 [Serendipita indica DSM 11827]